MSNLRGVAQVVADTLEAQRRAEVLSALNTLSRALDRSLEQMPCDPALLRAMLEACDPLLKGISAGRWIKLRQHLGTALRVCGIEVFQARDKDKLSQAWEELLSQADLKRQYGLHRILKYFTRQRIEPQDVRLEHLQQFRSALLRTSLMDGAEVGWRSSIKLWNLAAAKTPTWPDVRMELSCEQRILSLPWDTFPASFQADVEKFLSGGDADLEAVAFEAALRPVSPATADQRRKLLRLIASAYHLATGRGSELVALQTLTEIPRAQAALTRLKEFQGGVKPTSIHAAELLQVVARDWARSEERAKQLSVVVRNWRKALKAKDPSTGMRPKNRARLRQFDDPQTMAAILALPEKVRRSVSAKADPGHEDARRLMLALALEILLVAPLRLSNLVSLEVGKHLTWSGREEKLCRLLVRSEEIKWHGETIDALLNPQTSKLIREYIDNYRGVISAEPTTFLFPTAAGNRRNADAFSAALSKFLRSEIGVRVHVHLFRALALKIYLNARPGAVDDARRLLGHRHLSTTEKHYMQFDNERAIAAHAEVIEDLRAARLKRRRK